MTSFIAAGGSGRSTSLIPAVPAASSVTTIAFMGIAFSPICLFGGSRTNAGIWVSGARSQSVDTRPEEVSDDRLVSRLGAGPTIMPPRLLHRRHSGTAYGQGDAQQ